MNIRNAVAAAWRTTLLLALAGAAPTVRAAEFCVGGTVGLQGALQQFEDDGEDTVIRLRTGSYFLPTETWNDDARLTLAGGYTDANCTARTLDPAATVLRPSDGGVEPLVFASGLEIGSVTLRDFAVGLSLAAHGSVLFGGGDVRLTRTRVEGPLQRGLSLDGHRVYLNETIVAGSGSDNHFSGHCAVNIRGMDSSSDIVAIQHSVVTNSPNYGVCIGDPLANEDEEFQVWLDNNIFFANAMSLSIEETSHHVRRNNVIDGNVFEYGAADPGASGANSTANPLFVNAAAGDFRLQDASPAINSGRTSTFMGVPQYDIAGNPRWIGPAPDRGAYESAIDGTEVLTVTDSGDSDNPVVPGTLRWAIQQANASPNPSRIRFDIPGACPRFIILGGELPAITTPVEIDGYSQPGSAPNTLDGGLAGDGFNATICISLGGTSLHYGLRVPPGSNGSLRVSGIKLGGYLDAAIAIEAGTGSSVTGTHVFTDQPIGIFVGGSARDTQIGGAEPAQKNLIWGSGYGIALNPPSSGAIVERNLIGLAADGNSVGANTGNDVGIGISADDNTVRGNVIAGNGGGIAIFDGDRNNIDGNVLGRKVGFLGVCGLPPLPPCPSRDLANVSNGVLIQGDANDNAVQRNIIANSGQAGIRATAGQRNFFLGNAIWNSGGLAVDLNAAGPDPIDNDADPGQAALANRGLNRPGFAGALGGRLRGTAAGVLSSTNGTYVVQVYATPDCADQRSQARTLIGLGTVTIDGAQPGQSALGLIRVPVRSPNNAPLLGQWITMMVSEIGGPGQGNTSELSNCSAYLDDTIFADGFD